MILGYLLKFDYSKSLTALFMALQLAGCSEGSDNVNTTGTGTLNWTAPSAREDGNPLSLSEISGYRVYYGSTSGDYINSIEINDSTAQETTITAARGLYYYVITSFDTAGRESNYSQELNISI